MSALRRILVANRGDVALRVVRAARDLGLGAVAVHSRDDAGALHARRADAAVALPASGPAAYLDIAALVAAARAQGCDAVHPGWGFLAERADFARACADAGLVFIGPRAEQLELFGDKTRARELARRCGVPLLPGSAGPVSVDEAQAFFATQQALVGHGPVGDAGTATASRERPSADRRAAVGADTRAGVGAGVMLKAVGGGGGRGMRAVLDAGELAGAYARCASEARAAFGSDGVYVERLLTRARHVEVQVIGDGRDVVALGERDCTLQRRFQKLVEMAPSPSLPPALRAALTEAALRMAREVGYASLGTFEFLVDESSGDLPFVFIECNPRLQVEHTVTEEVTGLDLVQLQIGIAAGRYLAELGVAEPPATRGFALQWRINAETIDADGRTRPSSGVLARFDLPAGPGIRVDAAALAGDAPSPHYDPLLAKVVVHSGGGFDDLLRRARRALDECRIDGVATNLGLLRALAARPELAAQQVHTRFVEEHLAELVEAAHRLDARDAAERSPPDRDATPPDRDATPPDRDATPPDRDATLPDRGATPPDRGAKPPGRDATPPRGTPPAEAVAGGGVAEEGGGASSGRATAPHARDAASSGGGDGIPIAEDGLVVVRAPMPSRVAALVVAVGDVVPAGGQLAVLEAMKMEHLLHADGAGRVVELAAAVGDYLVEGQRVIVLEPVDAGAAVAASAAALDLDAIRPDLQAVVDRHAFTLDARRASAVARRHATGGRTARENIADLCELDADGDGFVEYGALAYAAQTRRRSLEDLIANTPADGIVTGVGTVNRRLFGAEAARCAVMAYDYTVLAGTQGWRNHHKQDRMLGLAHRLGLPMVLFAEGGGGRPGDVDMPVVAGLNNHTFSQFAALSGKVPVLGIVHGRCFAGNAALLGCVDTIVATRASNIGMSGPAMIEGGGLGRVAPEEIGPSGVQSANGVIDVLVDDEAHAVRVARRYLAYFQGAVGEWRCADQRLLRHAVPENRLRVYDVRRALDTLADSGSVLELRAGFGAGIVTALARIEGRPVGVMANNPKHLGGAIDPVAADKAARFMQLCDAHGLPLVSLVDTPGFMVGPDIEARAQVRHVCRMFVVAAKLAVPFFAVVLRKGYGLGAQAMTAGGFDAPVFTASWPTGEFGGMGLEGAVKLGYRKELDAVAEGAAREARFRELVAEQYARGGAINMAATLEIDAVIDPAETRSWLLRGLRAAPSRKGTRGYVDAW